MEGCARGGCTGIAAIFVLFGYVSVSVLTSVHHVSPSALGSGRHFLYTEERRNQSPSTQKR